MFNNKEKIIMEPILPIEALGQEGPTGKVLEKARAAPPWQAILDKMANPDIDAFQRMKIALYELFPAITSNKEEELKQLAQNFEDVVDLDELVEKAQSLFNDAKTATGGDLETITGDLKKTLDELQAGLKAASTPTEEGPGPMDPELADKLIATIEEMKPGISDTNLKNMWNQHQGNSIAAGNKVSYTTASNNIQSLKTQIDGYYELGTGISGFSAQLQARLQFEIGNYQQFLATNNEMYHQDSATTKVHVNKLAAK